MSIKQLAAHCEKEAQIIAEIMKYVRHCHNNDGIHYVEPASIRAKALSKHINTIKVILEGKQNV